MSLLSPKKTKYRKFQRRIRQIRGHNSKCNKLEYGEFGIQVKEGFFFKDKQIEALRLGALRIIRANKQKNGDIKFRVFPHKNMTKKPLQVRMGGGKGDIDYWAATVRPSTVICEFLNINLETAKQVFKELNIRLPVPATLIRKEKINKTVNELLENISKEKELDNIIIDNSVNINE